ncbi:hypothetical protein QBC34DRAFT_108469 [Podospora aff. communis PSN243]|uniref:Nephrocystin 3-like N-terminal domain-containing protein n=1 Tax=Podospora aff. communis PSN243 TaxID=3040156 RepID=A0AAV9H286_9PEZI|nr:hypothetical protein QBC34DRAFT_108469 [Podospora aff. communis PSN243]
MNELPADTGITVVYKPANPIADIIFVHGLQGHPYRTWTAGSTRSSRSPRLATPLASETSQEYKQSKRHRYPWNFFRRTTRARPQAANSNCREPGINPNPTDDHLGQHPSNACVFWPADLLPVVCPRARVLVYGYDTKVTNYMTSSTNKNSIYSHSKDLLYALSRDISPGRPLVFVAHSLGGIVVKEMLSRSSSSPRGELKDIVKATSAVMFLGTPHRGSPEFAGTGDWARSLLSSVRVETTPAMLHALGLKTTDLERAQEAFSAIWHQYGFRVKTFQEGLGLTGINLGLLGRKVVPDYSSSLGDEREHAETIQANHREMCRFTGEDDPGFRKVSGELRSIYASVRNGRTRDPLASLGQPRTVSSSVRQAAAPAVREDGMDPAPSQRSASNSDFGQATHSINSTDLQDHIVKGLAEGEQAYLRSLRFPNMNRKRRNIKPPTENTCQWLFESKFYRDWFAGKNREWPGGMLRLKGKPGSGKSVLMKAAYRQILREHRGSSRHCVAGYFFNEGGSDLEHSRAGALRTLLYQLLLQDRGYLSMLTRSSARVQSPDKIDWTVSALESTLRGFLLRSQPLRKKQETFIFIDGIDECGYPSDMHALSYFWRLLTRTAQKSGINLNVFLSCRYLHATHLEGCPEIYVDCQNKGDIAAYVEEKFKLGIATQEPKWSQLLDAIVEKCSGVFLWAVLVVDGLIEKWEQGEGLQVLINHLDQLPAQLSDLFHKLFGAIPQSSNDFIWRMFSWAALSARPLRLHEWHHVLAFTRQPAPRSLREWQESNDFTETDAQLERRVRSLSRGLLEVTSTALEPFDDDSGDSASAFAGAGSFLLHHGETRVIQLIHGSVCQFFLTRFSPLGTPVGSPADWTPALLNERSGSGHVAIMQTCLDYLHISELDALVSARRQAALRKVNRPGTRSIQTRQSEVGNLLVMEEKPPEWSGVERSIVTAESTSSPPPPHFDNGGIDISAWISGLYGDAHDSTNSLQDSRDIHPSSSDPASTSPPSVVSQVLGAYPALLSYVVDELFAHARLARQFGADLRPTFARIATTETWARWLALSEEESQDITFSDYLARKEFYEPGILPEYIPTEKPDKDPVGLEFENMTRVEEYLNSLYETAER